MSPRLKSGFWRRFRVFFRRFRVSVWLSVLVLVSGMAYLDFVGLPGFIKRPLLQKLRNRGLDLRFTRLRLSWFGGIVADNARLADVDQPLSPKLTLGEARVMLDPKALLRFRVQVNSLAIRKARLVWPVRQPDRRPTLLVIDDIQSDLRFGPNDEWLLENFKGRLAGARLHLFGSLSHASAVRQWASPHGRQASSAARWQGRLQKLADILEKTSFSAPPELRLDVRGDARDLRSFSVRMMLNAPDAQTPWGSLRNANVAARLYPATNREPSRALLSLRGVNARTPWGASSNLQVSLQFHSTVEDPKLVSLDGNLSLEGAHAARVAASRFGLSFHLEPAVARTNELGPSWGWWTNLMPFTVAWQSQASGMRAERIAADAIQCQGTWAAPALEVTNLEASIGGEKLEAHAALDVATRALHIGFDSHLDPRKLALVIDERTRNWLEQISSPIPPAIKADLSLVLPPWTTPEGPKNSQTERWQLPRLTGEFNLDQGGAFKGIPFSSLRSRVSYTDASWHLPDLVLTRPDGRVEADYEADETNGRFTCRLHSALDPAVFRPLLGTNEQRALDLFAFESPPDFEGEIQGRWGAPESLRVAGRITVTNFTFRGESFSSLRTSLDYTNRVLRFMAPRISRGAEQLQADGVAVDLTAERVYLTNGFGAADPGAVTRAIGPTVARAVEPYHFLRPPAVHASGIIPFRNEEDADIRFDVEGGPFHWFRFNLPKVSGSIHWKGLGLTLTNVDASFYGGSAHASAYFDFSPPRGTDVRFALETKDALLQGLMRDIWTRSNKLEGRLSGRLAITHANTEDWRTVSGNGAMELRNGLIWDIPLFGVFSPVLDGIAPGLGTSRARDGACVFGVTNGVLHSENLEVRSHTLCLRYRGSVDLAGELNARVEALLLRDMKVVGPVLSTVLWPVTKMFEYRITGTIETPKTQPVYFVPKVLLLPLRPLKTLKGLLQEESGKTDGPPTFQSVPGVPD